LSQTIGDISKQLRRWPSIYYWLPLIAWMGLIFWFSSRPQPLDLPEPWLETLTAKTGHAIGYAVLALLWRRALASCRATPGKSALALAFLLTVLYAISDEYHQTFVPGRNGNLADVLIDALGAALGLWLLRRWQKRNSGGKGDEPCAKC
jgi:VanZ family protein